MPTHLPNRPRAKAIHTDDVGRDDQRPHRRRQKHPIETIDWLALWVLSLGFSALLMAGTAFFSEHDATGAVVILGGASAIMALALRITEAPDDSQ